jgi:hypothetical protein
MVIQGHSPWAQPLALRRSGNSTGSTRIIVCAPRDGHVDTFDLYPLTFSDMNQELLEGSKGGGIHRSGNTRYSDQQRDKLCPSRGSQRIRLQHYN